MLLKLKYNSKCTTFTPQIKGIPEDTKAMYTSSQGYIYIYTGVYTDA